MKLALTPAKEKFCKFSNIELYLYTYEKKMFQHWFPISMFNCG